MTSEDFRNLATMLRLQLPILLSVSTMRCTCGYIAHRVVPTALKKRMHLVCAVARKTRLFVQSIAVVAILACFASIALHDASFSACTEVANSRLHGLATAVALFAIGTSSDVLTHTLSLCTLKAVADGSAGGVLLMGFVVASHENHHVRLPVTFFLLIFACNSAFSAFCSIESGVVGGSLLALAFCSLELMRRATMLCIHSVLSWGRRPKLA